MLQLPADRLPAARGCNPTVNPEHTADSMCPALQDVRSQAGAAQHGQRLEVPGDRAFLLYDSYGFPLEITAEIAAEQGVGVDAPGFEAAMAQQRQRSKDAVKVCCNCCQGAA